MDGSSLLVGPCGVGLVGGLLGLVVFGGLAVGLGGGGLVLVGGFSWFLWWLFPWWGWGGWWVVPGLGERARPVTAARAGQTFIRIDLGEISIDAIREI